MLDKKLKLLAIVWVCLYALTGCTLLEDVGGYDITACENNWDVCWELMYDNL